MPRMMREPRTALTWTELEKVMRQAKDESPKYHLAFLLSYYMGLRSKELSKMTLDDIKNDHMVFVDRCKGSKDTLQAMTKAKGAPHLDTVKAFDRWMDIRKTIDTQSRALFVSQKTGSFIRREQFSRAFAGIAERAGLPAHKRFIHSLKHSVCSHMAEVGRPLVDIAALAGHKALSSTQQYVHISDAQGVRSMQTMVDMMRRRDGDQW